MKVTDNSLEHCIYSYCYQMNPKTGFYEFKFNQGIVETCEVEEGWQVGAFFKNNFYIHKADFSVSGEVNNSVPVEPRELGKFNEANGISIRLVVQFLNDFGIDFMEQEN